MLRIPSFKPKTLLSTLDNESSLVPLLVKDMWDNVGRSHMEFSRGDKGRSMPDRNG